MIREATFEEFRALRSLTVSFERLTVLVGPNGSGKTSILEGVHYLLQIARRPLKDVLAGPWRPDRLRNTRAQGVMALALVFDGAPPSSLVLTVVPTGVGGVAPLEEGEARAEMPFGESAADVDNPFANASQPPPYRAFMRASVDGQDEQWNPDEQRLRDQKPIFAKLAQHTVGAFFLRLSPRALAAPSYVDAEEPTLGPDGQNLASVIADLAAREPERKEAITEALRRVVPEVRRIRTERAKVMRSETEFITVGAERVPYRKEHGYWGNRVLLDTSSGEAIPLHAVSEGTALTLGLMTLLHGSRRPRTLLMDDLDRALHPRAQQQLVAVLRESLAEDPSLQVVATSHSPFLLNALGHDEVRLTALADDGSVLCAPLREHPSFERWKNLVQPGELWSSELEDWVRQPKAAAS